MNGDEVEMRFLGQERRPKGYDLLPRIFKDCIEIFETHLASELECNWRLFENFQGATPPFLS
jgi:hypothetical protein